MLNNLVCKSTIIYEINENGSDSNGQTKTTTKQKENSTIPPLTVNESHVKYLQPSSSIAIDYSMAFEAISTLDLISSDNKCLSKTIAVFIQLCQEVRQLCKEGNKILINVLFADEDLCELLSRDEEEQLNFDQISSPQNDQDINSISLSTRVINKISDLLDLLLQAQQFIERCYVVISEIILQFSALFSTETSNYINVDHSSLHFQVNIQMRFLHLIR